MNQSVEKKVVSYITGKEDIEAVDIEQLRMDEAESPYFPITQLFLAKKLAEKNGDEYASQVQKTALYFSNPYWLQYLLSVEEAVLEQEQSASAATEGTVNYIEVSPPDSITDITPPSSKIITSEVIDEDKVVTPTVLSGEILVPPVPVSTVVAETDENSIPLASNVQADEEMAATAGRSGEGVENFIEQLEPVNITETPADDRLSTPVSESEKSMMEEEKAGVTYLAEESSRYLAAEIEEEPAIANQPDDEHERMFQNIKAMLDATSEDAGADIKNAIVPMDPYYTIDYFASQGIKLELDKQPEDQLGQSLKKFTHWLRHMKKLGPEDATEVISRTETEADIQEFADTSNTVREVVTEAMATVLEKQGKKEKAIELYNKLSFLNPDKSTYFAGKINKLKGF